MPHINLKNTFPVTDFFFPDVEIERNSRVSGYYYPAEHQFNLLADFPGLRWKELKYHDLNLSLESDDSLAKVLEETDAVLEETIDQAGGVNQLTYTFWISDSKQVFSPGPVTRPTAAEIWKISELALAKGINHIDYYAFDVGGASLADEAEWKRFLPGTEKDYPLSKQFRQTWLKDRPGGVLRDLGLLIKAYRKR